MGSESHLKSPFINLLLADDDADDRLLFEEALTDLPIQCAFKSVTNGAQLMDFLHSHVSELPDVLFLDLNMPLKNGFECFTEIRLNEKLKSLTVIIYSTSLVDDVVNLLYENGAQYYVRKPGDFSELKKIIHAALLLAMDASYEKPPKENFVIEV